MSSRQQLLQSITDVARAIFLAEAASIAMLDAAAGAFRFEAVAGQGADRLLGSTFPFGEGIAGSVAQTGEPLVVDDLSGDPRFARNVAEESGYVPRAIMVAPLLRDDDTLGVLSVLDRGTTGRTTLQELELLELFAAQAALALAIDEGVPEGARVVRLDGLPAPRREAAERLLDSLDELLRT
jgi:GAF domain-containing protein